MKKQFRSVKRWQRQHPQEFDQVLEHSEDLQRMKEQYGPDLSNGIPQTRYDFASKLQKTFSPSEKIAQEIVDELSHKTKHRIKESEELQEWENTDIHTIDSSSLPLEQRIRLEILKKQPVQQLAEIEPKYTRTYFLSGHLSKEDYKNSKVIKPEEYPVLIQRFGKAVIFNSLDPSSLEYQEISQKQRQLQQFLLSLNKKQRIHLQFIKLQHPYMYRLASELYKTYDAALRQVCGHGLKTYNPLEFEEDAFALFVEKGEKAAEAFFRQLNVPKNILDKTLERYVKIHHQRTGRAKKTSSSQLEHDIEKMLNEKKAFYMRHIPYSSFLSTDRKYTADFMIITEDAKHIIEVCPIEDSLLLSPEIDRKYRQTMEDKRRLAQSAGIDFIEFTEFSSMEEVTDIIQGSIIPQQFKLPEKNPRYHKCASPYPKKEPKNSSQRVYHASARHTNPYIIGKLKAQE